MLAIGLVLVGCGSSGQGSDATPDKPVWPDLVPPTCMQEGCVECEPLSTGGACEAGAGDGPRLDASAGLDAARDASAPKPSVPDDVPADRDPWPSLCKKRLFADSFRNYLNWKNYAYDGDKPKYGSSLVGVDHNHCGLLHISPPSPNYTVMTDLKGTEDESTLNKSLIPSTTAGYLIEARISSPGAPSGTSLTADIDWPAGLKEDVKGQYTVTARSCSLRRNATPPDRLTSIITERVVAADGKVSQKTLGSKDVEVRDLPAGWLTMQSYVIEESGGDLGTRKVLYCRLLQGKWKAEVKTPMLSLKGTGNARLTFSNNSTKDKDPVWGLRLFVDWVRAYDSPR
jgi:hypothetical protein